MLFACLCIVIDGHNAYLAVLWDFISVPSVRHCRSFLHGRHRRGGQSAARFQRHRQGAEDAYLKRILDIVRESGHTFKDLVLGGSHHLCHKLLDLMKHPSPLFVSTSEPASTGCLYKLVRLWRRSQASQGRISGAQMEVSKKKTWRRLLRTFGKDMESWSATCLGFGLIVYLSSKWHRSFVYHRCSEEKFSDSL